MRVRTASRRVRAAPLTAPSSPRRVVPDGRRPSAADDGAAAEPPAGRQQRRGHQARHPHRQHRVWPGLCDHVRCTAPCIRAEAAESEHAPPLRAGVPLGVQRERRFGPPAERGGVGAGDADQAGGAGAPQLGQRRRPHARPQVHPQARLLLHRRPRRTGPPTKRCSCRVRALTCCVGACRVSVDCAQELARSGVHVEGAVSLNFLPEHHPQLDRRQLLEEGSQHLRALLSFLRSPQMYAHPPADGQAGRAGPAGLPPDCLRVLLLSSPGPR